MQEITSERASFEYAKAVFANNIRLLRATKGFTMKDFASQLNISRKLYSSIEKGDAYPDLMVICRVAEMFELDYNTLLQRNLGDFVTEMWQNVKKI